MSNKRQAVDIGQLNIFDLIEKVERKQAAAAASRSFKGKASIDAAVRSIISASLKDSQGNRYEVATLMSDNLGVEITKAQMDAWSAESKENHRLPIVYAPAFCQATGNYTLIRYIAELCDGYFIEGSGAIDFALGRIEEEMKKLQAKRKALREIKKQG